MLTKIGRSYCKVRDSQDDMATATGMQLKETRVEAGVVWLLLYSQTEMVVPSGAPVIDKHVVKRTLLKSSHAPCLLTHASTIDLRDRGQAHPIRWRLPSEVIMILDDVDSSALMRLHSLLASVGSPRLPVDQAQVKVLLRQIASNGQW